jgi:hypothetical protein
LAHAGVVHENIYLTGGIQQGRATFRFVKVSGNGRDPDAKIVSYLRGLGLKCFGTSGVHRHVDTGFG